MRNLLAHSPVKHRSEVAAGARLVQQVQDLVEAKRWLSEFVERFGKSVPKAVVDEFAEWAAARAAAGNGQQRCPPLALRRTEFEFSNQIDVLPGYR